MGSYLLQAIAEDDLESGDDQVLSLYSVRELLTLHLHSIAAPLTEEGIQRGAFFSSVSVFQSLKKFFNHIKFRKQRFSRNDCRGSN